mgnify:CR=1 FL=1
MALVHGYPCTKNKQFKALFGGTSFKSFAFSYGGKIDRNYASWAPFRKMEEIHIGMKYGKAKDVKGAVVTPPKPQGISGGGLCIMPDSFKPTELYLAGIAIERHKGPGLVFSTKIKIVIEFIEQNAYQAVPERPAQIVTVLSYATTAPIRPGARTKALDTK